MFRIGPIALCACALAGCSQLDDDGYHHVRPGSSIQEALERAARDPMRKRIKVHAGTYRPTVPGQALIWFNARHDGISLEADGAVILTAANPEIADPSAPSFPAVVNHVVYFGDGISQRTALRGFKITGANNFVTQIARPGPIEPSNRYERNLFFYADGGGIKIFGESYPTLEHLEVYDNYASPCGGGISVQHPASRRDPGAPELDAAASVVIRDCIFRNNRARVTGSAVDLLWGSSAIIENCLFVGNVSNTGTDFTIPPGKTAVYDSEHGCGALTVFQGARVEVRRCTFTANYNGVDDMSAGNGYTQSIFWRNDASGGIAPGARYELAMLDGGSVEGCFLNGDVVDLRGTVIRERNTFDAPDPDFDSDFRPRAAAYVNAGYRPAGG